MAEKWMVYDTASGDMISHDTKEKAEEDFDKAVEDLEDGDLAGEHQVQMFRLEKMQTIINYPED